MVIIFTLFHMRADDNNQQTNNSLPRLLFWNIHLHTKNQNHHWFIHKKILIKESWNLFGQHFKL